MLQATARQLQKCLWNFLLPEVGDGVAPLLFKPFVLPPQQ